MHPAWLRRSSVKYSRYSSSSTPCQPGASTLSVRGNFWSRTLVGSEPFREPLADDLDLFHAHLMGHRELVLCGRTPIHGV